jgi:ubiquinone/menaquinone biosynthesis C-methylase UbiE
MENNLKNKIIKNLTYSYSMVRGLNFTMQASLLPLVDFLVTQKKKENAPTLKDHITLALPQLERLFKQDAKNISDGLYPPSVLFEEAPWTHFSRVPILVKDAFRASLQRKNKKAHEFSANETEFLDESPEYFKRNFHFQKDGYLSDDSAMLYDHQVEVLFSGSANTMRRMIIPSLKSHFSNSQGEGLKFLEVGCGTGALTRSVALAFPKAQITCVDLSPHYLQRAKNKLRKFKRINFNQGLAENLEFKDETFDAVFSCYLFHELPEKVRKDVLTEKLRVIKKQGYIGVVDSIQRDDNPDLNWALEQFPKDFHEPFYKNYIEKKLEDLMTDLAVQRTSTEVGFLSKLVSAQKL